MSIAAVRKQEINANKLAKRLRRQVGQAIADFHMIEDGDRVMVCLSGGKDSYTLLDLLRQLQAKAPVSFELHAVHLDQKQPGYDARTLPGYLESIGMPHTILEQDTYSVVKRVIPEGRTMCSLCSRLRRGNLYDHAAAEGFTKIALGHHRDDIVETLFLNLFHQAKLKAMPPKLRSDDGRNVVIRPLAYCREGDIADYAAAKAFPIMPCNLCGSQENLQRKAIKAMLADWDRQFPGRVENVFRAIGDISPSQLADRTLFDFAALGSRSELRASAGDWLRGEPADAANETEAG
ncbi:MAG TPA: tRNA 2-thiocytidine(32) synthetase TtcA [Tahibacter sp.]|uniref:tRNA 2-thiocytidine(32) synthetase TtcA n=1 Tax=Tahibacter sp. TaxID=2056211 RepID=UPI002C6B802C|nr:tRNA 2-thiocytidine(32) synthetase TtcA [Tahibacter sp.]HSX61589.1 tRNA 2-thiocytidine(32) synthetase TtcA [Tahibacter sp.]